MFVFFIVSFKGKFNEHVLKLWEEKSENVKKKLAKKLIFTKISIFLILALCLEWSVYSPSEVCADEKMLLKLLIKISVCLLSHFLRGSCAGLSCS